MEPTVLLIPSPLLGPASWASTAEVLRGRGHAVKVPSLQGVADAEPPFWPAGVEAIVRAAGEDPVVLVPHSNSGLYVPAVLSALGEQVRGVVFVDAALPDSGALSRRDFLDALVEPDGRLPPWTSWWPDSDVSALFPDVETRARVEREQARLPRAYYDRRPPAPGGWDTGRCAYLWFGEPYDARAAEATAAGWPTRQVAGGHLHMLVDPEAVVAAILELAGLAARG